MTSVGEIVFGGQLLVAIPLALVAGLISFASPCVLPLVPGYLGYVSAIAGSDAAPASNSGRRRFSGRVVAGVGLFVLGFTVVFVTFGILFGTAGLVLKPYLGIINVVLGIAIVILGLVFIGFFGVFQRTAKLNLTPRLGLVGAPLLGVVFGLGWTPCIGPTLGAIMALSLDAASPWRGALLGLFYCVGLGVPFLLIALGLQWATKSVSFIKRHVRTINIIGGVLLIVIGLLLATGLWNVWMSALQAVIGSYVPSL